MENESKRYRGTRFLILVGLFYICLAIYFTGCAENDKHDTPSGLTCSVLSGHYYQQSNSANTLDIASDCSFTDSVCGYTASFTQPSSDNTTTITVYGTNGTPGCMSSTNHYCDIGFNGVQLGIICDSGTRHYLFIKQ